MCIGSDWKTETSMLTKEKNIMRSRTQLSGKIKGMNINQQYTFYKNIQTKNTH